jgi:hypothetical protein
MRIRKTLAVAASGCALMAAGILPATASTPHVARQSHPVVASKLFHSTLNHHSGVKNGTKLVLRGTGAKKNTLYFCVLVALKGSSYVTDGNSIHSVTSSGKGVVTCKETFAKYTETVKGKKFTCPKAPKGYKCGFAASTSDKSSNTIQYFT